MPETLITPVFRWILACIALLGASALSVDAVAQTNPPGAPPPPPPAQGAAANPVNPMCPRLETQLATIDHRGGTGDPAKDAQIPPYQDPPTNHQPNPTRVTPP